MIPAFFGERWWAAGNRVREMRITFHTQSVAANSQLFAPFEDEMAAQEACFSADGMKPFPMKKIPSAEVKHCSQTARLSG